MLEMGKNEVKKLILAFWRITLIISQQRVALPTHYSNLKLGQGICVITQPPLDKCVPREYSLALDGGSG